MLGELEERTGQQRDLPLAAVALEEAARAQAAEAVRAAGGAGEAAGPADADERVLALRFGAVAIKEGGEAEAFLELDLVLGMRREMRSIYLLSSH